MKLKANHGIDYLELIKQIEVVPVCEYMEDKICLRHDVDASVEHAYKLALLEATNGIRSTYYILTPEKYTANYFGRWNGAELIMSEKTKMFIKKIKDLNHEIGYHSNLVTLSRQTGFHPQMLMDTIVKCFNEIGVELKTTASHGDQSARENKYINYQIFTELGKQSFDQISLKDYGLTEAYFLKRINYLSDSGGMFALCTDKVERDIIDKEKIFNFVKEMKRPSQILIHPIWWE